jgi:hypothetical protein
MFEELTLRIPFVRPVEPELPADVRAHLRVYRR